MSTIVSRDAIAKHASECASTTLRTGSSIPNPWPEGSEAAEEWQARFDVALQRLRLDHDVEASA